MATIYATTTTTGLRYDVVLGEQDDIIKVLNLASLDISNTIKFCKSLTAFRLMKPDDQLSLLKRFYPARYLIRLCHLYEPKQDGWVELAVSVKGEWMDRRRGPIY